MYFKNCAIMKRWRKKTGSTTEFCIAEDGVRGGEGKIKVRGYEAGGKYENGVYGSNVCEYMEEIRQSGFV
jgi:hypothetical protein